MQMWRVFAELVTILSDTDPPCGNDMNNSATIGSELDKNNFSMGVSL